MTHYEKVTREEIARRNYSEGTTRAYLRVLHDLAGYFQHPPERLRRDQIRQYSAHLITDRKLSGNTVRRKRTVWLFPGGTHHTANTPITEKV